MWRAEEIKAMRGGGGRVAKDARAFEAVVCEGWRKGHRRQRTHLKVGVNIPGVGFSVSLWVENKPRPNAAERSEKPNANPGVHCTKKGSGKREGSSAGNKGDLQ